MINRKKPNVVEVAVKPVEEKPVEVVQESVKNFIPLHVHTDYSVADSILDVDQYVNWAVENKIPSIAVTDHGNLCHAILFNQGCLKKGIKPITGIEAYCMSQKEWDNRKGGDDKKEDSEAALKQHLVLLAKNHEGYKQLLQLNGRSMREHYYYKPVILYEDLLDYAGNIIVSSACLSGRVAMKVRQNKHSEAADFVKIMKDTFKDDFYLEIMENEMPEQRIVNEWIFENYKKLGVKIIFTTDTHYLKKNHDEYHDSLKIIGRKRFWSEGRERLAKDGIIYNARHLYCKTRAQLMEELNALDYHYDMSIIEEALDNTLEIDSKIEPMKLTTSKITMPSFGANAFDILKNKVFTELKNKGLDKDEVYVHRLNRELEVIQFKRMEDYFLIIEDIIRFCERNDIGYGCGRGSGCGSLTVYLLGVTKINPLKYNLFFERFLNVARKDPPDIDLDFDNKRPMIEEYLKEKYGKDNVAHIISFGRFGVKGCIRDTFRIYFGVDFKEYLDMLFKYVPNDEDEYEDVIKILKDKGGEKFEEFYKKYEKQFDIAKNLQNKIRHYSMHAGGVIIVPSKLEDYIPIMRVKNVIVSGFAEGGDTRTVTDSGLMKFDLLGLNACTIIKHALKKVNKISKEEINLSTIIANDNDPEIIKQFAIGNTVGIFQFEGAKITDFTVKVAPKKFEELVSINALYRPAVITAGGLDNYLENKENFQPGNDPFLNLLKDTYGIMCYQEQTLETFSKLGGLSLEEADEARHTLKLLFKGGNDRSEFDKLMAKFRDGCHKNTKYTDKEIEGVMDYVKQFSQYSFNKSHACAYAMMGYIMMYLKLYYTAEFFSALLTFTANAESIQDKVAINVFTNYTVDALANGLEIKKPDVNISAAYDVVIKNKKELYLSLNKIKNVGEKAALTIEEKQPFSSFKDFVERIDLRKCNKRVIQAMIIAGALRKFPDLFEVYKKKYKEDVEAGIDELDKNGKLLETYFKHVQVIDFEDLKILLNIKKDLHSQTTPIEKRLTQTEQEIKKKEPEAWKIFSKGKHLGKNAEGKGVKETDPDTYKAGWDTYNKLGSAARKINKENKIKNSRLYFTGIVLSIRQITDYYQGSAVKACFFSIYDGTDRITNCYLVESVEDMDYNDKRIGYQPKEELEFDIGDIVQGYADVGQTRKRSYGYWVYNFAAKKVKIEKSCKYLIHESSEVKPIIDKPVVRGKKINIK